MEIYICQSCGVMLRSKGKNCTACGSAVSRFASTALPVMANAAAPLAVSLPPDPLVLERVVVSRRLGTYQKSGNGNGNGGNGGNGHHDENGGTDSSSPLGAAMAGLGGLGGGLLARKPGGSSSMFSWGAGDDAAPTQEEPSSSTPQPDPLAPSAEPPLPVSFTNFTSPLSPSFQVPSSFDPAPVDPAPPVMPAQQPAELSAASSTPAPWETPKVPTSTPDAFASGAAVASSFFSAALPVSPEPQQVSPEPVPEPEPVKEPESSLTTGPATAEAFPFESPSTLVTAPDPVAESEAPPEVATGTQLIPQPEEEPQAALPAIVGQPEASDTFETAVSPSVSTDDTESDASDVFGDDDLGKIGPSEGPTEEAQAEENSGVSATAMAVAAGAVAGAITGAIAGAVTAGASRDEDVEEAEPASEAVDGQVDDFSAAPQPAPSPAPQLSQPAAGSNDFFAMGPDALRNSQSKTDSGFMDEGTFSNSPAPSDSFFNATANDFFTAAPIPKPKMEGGTAGDSAAVERARSNDDEDMFPDDTHMRGKKEAKKTEEDRPKVARPKGYAPKGDAPDEKPKVKLQVTDDDSTESGDEDEEEKVPPPARRSFSSNKGATIARPKGADKGKAKAKSKGDDDDDDETDDEDDDTDKSVGFLEKEVNVMGLSLTRKTAGILCAVFLTLSIIVFNTFCTIATYMAGNFSNLGNRAGGMLPPQMQALPNISGMYELRYMTELDRKGGAWNLQIAQNGGTFFARGEDRGGPWGIDGKIEPPNKFGFRKYYIKDGKISGKPIIYYGRYTSDELGRVAMTGDLQFEIHKGVFLHSKWVPIKGKFEMKQLYSLPSEGGTAVVASAGGSPQVHTSAPGQNVFGVLKDFNSGTSDREKTSKVFMNIAFTLLGVGVLIALIALSIFGPSGKLNILAKQEYIPSQYKAQHNKMVREWARGFQAGGVPLGNRSEWRVWKPWQTKTLAMPPDARKINPHILVMGGSDKGKTRFVANMITHDIESNDRAVVVIDSDGELCDLVTRWVAAHPKGQQLVKRIIVIDPTYKGGSLSYNPLEVPDDGNMIDAASAIVHGFKAIYTEPPGSQSQWNQQTANILRNAAILLMANNKTLTDLPTLLQDNDFRDILLEGVEKKKRERTEYSTLLETWGQYKRLARTDQWINWSEPILNRVTPMLSDPRIRPILTKPVGDLRLRDLIINKQVLFIRIPTGQLDQNANLLGSLLVTGLKQAALALADSAKSSKSRPVALYMDELNNFIEKETIEALTQETSKFQIGFVGCCKTLQHLPEDFRNNMVINMGTICAFALAKKDGDMLGPQMFRVDGRKIKHQTIQNFFNKVNTSPQFELISDEEKLNIDRVVGQEERHFFCYKVGTVAGTFHLKTHEFNDIPDVKVKQKLIDQMHKGSAEKSEAAAGTSKKKKKEED